MGASVVVGGGVVVAFWRGRGLIPVLIRLFSRHRGQAWADVPAHCAVLLEDSEGFTEYEAISTGIRRGEITRQELDEGTVAPMVMIPVTVPNFDAMVQYLNEQVGQRYGYEAVAATGLAIVAPSWLDRWLSWSWLHLAGGRSGRSCPKDCSLLVWWALSHAGLTLPGREDGLPVSPNDLLQLLKRL